MPAQRKPKLSRGRKIALTVAAAVVFAGGLYLGIQVAKPPPPPDLQDLIAEREGRAEIRPDTGARDPKPSVETASLDADPGAATEEGASASDVPPSADPQLDTARQPAPGAGAGPRIALVVDDLGRSVADVEKLAKLGIPITFSVLPFEVRTPEVVAELRRRGLEYLCHLPMEAKGGANPGPGALLSSMGAAELRATVERAFDAVPGAAGVNNHMGSAVMSDASALGVILDRVRARDLYFLDSRTSVDTLGYSLARRRGIPAAERQVFLDARPDQAFVRGQWQELLATARLRGAALAIAHPHDDTLAVLSQEVPAARRAGFRFVTASELLDR